MKFLKNQNILDSYEEKQFKPYFLNFGNGAKLFAQDSSKKQKILLYKENEGKLLIYSKYDLHKPKNVYLLKMNSIFKITVWNAYFLILTCEKGYKLKIVSKKVLERGKRSKNVGIFHIFELNEIEIVIFF